MNVALIHPAFSTVGGAEVVALNQARWLRDNGFSVRIVTGSVAAPQWADDLRDFRVDVLGSETWSERMRGRHAAIVRKSRELSELLADVEVAVAHNYPMSHVLALTETRARKVWYCHEPNRQLHLAVANPTIAAHVAKGLPPETQAERFYLAAQRSQRLAPLLWPGETERERDVAAVQNFDLVCVNSNYTHKIAERTFGKRPYSVVYPLMEFPERAARRSGLRRARLNVLVHSRLEPPKNVDTIVRGFARFVSGRASPAALHVVGEGSSRPGLIRLAEKLGIAAKVTFHGFLPQGELHRIYDACDIFALAPIDEPFGLVFLEAAIRGLLIVGPDHGGPFEITNEGRLGLACDPFSPQSIADAFEKIAGLSDRETDTKCGAQMLAEYGLTSNQVRRAR